MEDINIMTKSEIELQDKFIENKMKVESYMTKEELITMITNIDFKMVRDCSLNLITGIICQEDGTLKELYKSIRID